MEGRSAAGHLIEDHTQGPKISECTGLLPIKHLRSYIKGRPNECFRSFRFLNVLKFVLRACIERGAIVFTIIECFTVSKVDLRQ